MCLLAFLGLYTAFKMWQKYRFLFPSSPTPNAYAGIPDHTYGIVLTVSFSQMNSESVLNAAGREQVCHSVLYKVYYGKKQTLNYLHTLRMFLSMFTGNQIALL